MWIFGMRTTTWLAMLPFLYVSLRRDNPRPFLALLAWLTGFESAYQLTSLAFGRPFPSAFVVTVARFGLTIHLNGLLVLVGLGAVTVPLAWLAGLRPDLRIVAVVAGLWIVWVATGFHVNQHTMTGFDPFAEALNEAAKTALAVAYVLPLWPRRTARRPEPLLAP